MGTGLAGRGTAQPPGQGEAWPPGGRNARLADRRGGVGCDTSGSRRGLGLGRAEGLHPGSGVPPVVRPVLHGPGLLGRIGLGRHQPGGGHHPADGGSRSGMAGGPIRLGRRNRRMWSGRLGAARPRLLRQFIPGGQFGAHLLGPGQRTGHATGRRWGLGPGQFAIRFRRGIPGRPPVYLRRPRLARPLGKPGTHPAQARATGRQFRATGRHVGRWRGGSTGECAVRNRRTGRVPGRRAWVRLNPRPRRRTRSRESGRCQVRRDGAGGGGIR